MFREWRYGITVDYRTDGTPQVAVCHDPDAFLRHGDELLREIPVDRLSLGRVEPRAAALAAHPGVQRMRGLRLYDLGDGGAAAFGAARLPALRELVAARSGLTGAGAAALLGGGLGAGLEQLDLSHNDLGAAGAAAIAAARLDRLLELRLRGCRIDAAGAAALVPARLPALRLLDLGGDVVKPGSWSNWLDVDGARALAGAGWPLGLERLLLDNDLVGPAGAAALAAAGGSGPVDVDLRGNDLDDPAARALAAAPWSRLRRIGLTGNRLHSDQVDTHYDWDGSAVGEGLRPLTAAAIATAYGFTARGVEVY
jgi:Leucine Rich Repeat (LRR) protein